MIWCPVRENPEESILRKEVIQPQVPLRLPCYDLVPIDRFVFGACPLAVGTATSDAPHAVPVGVKFLRSYLTR